MNQNYLTFEFLTSLTNRTTFINQFGAYFLKIRNDSPDIDDLLMMSSDSGTQLAFDLIEGRHAMYNTLKVFIDSEIRQDFDKINIVLTDLKVNDRSKVGRYVSLVMDNMQLLKGKIAKCKWLADSGIEEHLKEFENDIAALYQNDSNTVNQSTFKRIKWHAGPAVLGTLFYDLSRLKDKQGKLYFTASPTELTAAVISIFIDENGDEFSRESILTYIDPNRLDKKAKKQRINLPE